MKMELMAELDGPVAKTVDTDTEQVLEEFSEAGNGEDDGQGDDQITGHRLLSEEAYVEDDVENDNSKIICWISLSPVIETTLS